MYLSSAALLKKVKNSCTVHKWIWQQVLHQSVMFPEQGFFLLTFPGFVGEWLLTLVQSLSSVSVTPLGFPCALLLVWQHIATACLEYSAHHIAIQDRTKENTWSCFFCCLIALAIKQNALWLSSSCPSIYTLKQHLGYTDFLSVFCCSNIQVMNIGCVKVFFHNITDSSRDLCKAFSALERSEQEGTWS